MQINNEKLRGENSIHYVAFVFGLYVTAWRFCKLAKYFKPDVGNILQPVCNIWLLQNQWREKKRMWTAFVIVSCVLGQE
jgi:hypothetical protein